MDKNIAAILREDTKTCRVVFKDGGNTSSEYTYITHLDVKEDDYVVVPTGSGGTETVVLMEHSFYVEVPDNFDPRPGQVAALKAKKEKVQAEFSKRVMELDEQINSLLALEA